MDEVVSGEYRNPESVCTKQACYPKAGIILPGFFINTPPLAWKSASEGTRLLLVWCGGDKAMGFPKGRAQPCALACPVARTSTGAHPMCMDAQVSQWQDARERPCTPARCCAPRSLWSPSRFHAAMSKIQIDSSRYLIMESCRLAN